MNDDEIASRLIDTLKGGAYLIASSIFITGFSLVLFTLPIESSSNEHPVFTLLRAGVKLLFLVYLPFQAAMYAGFLQKARNLLGR